MLLSNILEEDMNFKEYLDVNLLYVEQLLPDIFQKLYLNNIKFSIDNFINKVGLSTKINDIIMNTNVLKINLEIFYYIYKKTKYSYKNIMKVFNKIDKSKYLKSTSELNIYFDKDFNVKKFKYYNLVINDINVILNDIKSKNPKNIIKYN